MSDDILKALLANAKKQDLMQQLEGGNISIAQLGELITTFAPMILSEIESFEKMGGRQILADIAEEGHSSAVDFINTELPMAAFMLRQSPKENVLPIISLVQAQYTTEKVMEQVKQQKQQVNVLSEDEHIEMQKMFYDALPNKMREFWMTVYDISDESEIPELVRKQRAYIANASEEKLAADMVEILNSMKPEQLYDVGMDLAAHFSADGAQKLTDAFTAHVKPSDIADVMNAGLDLVKEFAQASADTGKVPEFSQLSTISPFAKAFKSVLQGVEDAIIDGDAVPQALKTWAAGARGAFLPKP